jgi:protein LSM14
MAAVPLPAALTSKVAQQTQPTASPARQQATAAELRDATEAAKAAVAVAMAKLGQGGSSTTVPAAAAQQANQAVLQNLAKEGGALDNLTRKVGEMRVNAGPTRGSPNTRGRGRGGHRAAKVEVPDADFDFAESNAKFNKEEVVKEVASPLHELAQDGGEATPEPESQATGTPDAPPAYNKSKSFFDNISSEAKDRAENNGMKPGGREWRGEEQRKNMETFGQGSVDGGYRGGYRGRGRGRGGRGRGYGRGGAARGGNPAFRNNRETQSAA